ncbi:MAG: hypothetical protein FP814_04075 [Desulfobacterium sp.]|nr:hypothetical protein [Desulfobacterium sp.]MBU4035183.1 hypothetical protein [Pseudomonadota bacterium]
MGFSEKSTLKEVMENESSKAVMEKHVPGISTNPMLKMGYSMSLKKVSGIPQTGISAEKLKAILDDLSKL